MGLWGITTADGDKPKFLPVDKNAAGSTGSREHAIAVAGGWGLSPGLAASGNDNTAATPEVLVCVKNLAIAMGAASIIGIDWTDATVGNVATFDITVTFDEAVDITSAAWTNNQVVTNKAYILLSRLGKTDMVEDSTIACQYYSGSGTNQLTFRGRVTTNAAAGWVGFNGSGVGDDAFSTGIVFNGTSSLDEEDGNSALGIRQEAGTAASPSYGDGLILDSTAGTVMTVNGALSGATTLVVNEVSGATLVVGQVVTVKGAGASITDSDGETGISTDNTLTITAVASQTSVTISEAITVANDIVLLASTNGGDEMIADGISMTVAGPTFASRSDITTVTRSGGDDSVAIELESNTDNGAGRLIQDTAANDTDPLVVEDKVSDIATYLEQGSTSGSAYILTGLDIAAA
jgi:hypothetical protein